MFPTKFPSWLIWIYGSIRHEKIEWERVEYCLMIQWHTDTMIKIQSVIMINTYSSRARLCCNAAPKNSSIFLMTSLPSLLRMPSGGKEELAASACHFPPFPLVNQFQARTWLVNSVGTLFLKTLLLIFVGMLIEWSGKTNKRGSLLLKFIWNNSENVVEAVILWWFRKSEWLTCCW